MNDIRNLIDTNNIQLEISIILGRTRQTVAQLSEFKPDDVLVLDQAIEDGVEICVGDKVIARGELTGDGSPDERLCVRITGAIEEE